MDSIVYGNLRIEILAEHGGRIQRTTLQAKPPAIHAQSHSLVPSGPVRLQGRDAEIAAAQAISTGEAIEFSAACGFGKSTLLQYLAAQARAQAGAAIYMRVGSQHRDDLLQRLVDALYTANSPFKPTSEQRIQLLAGARALVVLDDVSLGPSALREVLDALPGCAVVVGSDRPVLGRCGRSIPLPGLPNHTALQVLRRDLGRDLSAAERADAERLCELVDGQPLHLRQAAALIGQGRHSFADLARIAEGDVFALDRLSVNALAEYERRVLAVLALAAGALLPSGLVGSITDLANVAGVLNSLHRRGLVEQEDDRFGLPICRAEDYRALLLRYLELAQAARELATWVQRQAWSSQEAQSAADAALRIIGCAAERGEWQAVVGLVQAIEPVLALAGRWEAWREALEQGLEAAQAVGDVAAEAHLAHQLGVLEFALDRLDRARGSGSGRFGCVRRSATRQGQRSRVPISRCSNPLGPDPVAHADADACPPSARPARRSWPGLRSLRSSSHWRAATSPTRGQPQLSWVPPPASPAPLVEPALLVEPAPVVAVRVAAVRVAAAPAVVAPVLAVRVVAPVLAARVAATRVLVAPLVPSPSRRTPPSAPPAPNRQAMRAAAQ